MTKIEFIAVSWSDRSDTPIGLAEKLNRALVWLKGKYPEDFNVVWYGGGNSREEAMKIKGIEVYDLVEQFMNRANIAGDGSVLGYHAGGWSEREKVEYGYGVAAGGFNTNREYPNNISIDIPNIPSRQSFYLTNNEYKKIADKLIEIWNPDIVRISGIDENNQDFYREYSIDEWNKEKELVKLS